jgi:hypothetical protein
MKLQKIFMLIMILAFFSSDIFATSTIVYRNTKGSILYLNINPNNTLTGSFISAVASKECPQAIGMKRPIVGFVAKNAVTISISYPECGVVNLIGNIEDNKNVIDAFYVVAHPSHDIAKEGPGARMIGHDVFHRM